MWLLGCIEVEVALYKYAIGDVVGRRICVWLEEARFMNGWF